MTSNAGTTNKSSTIGFNNDSKVANDIAIHDAMKKYFRPEFLNRIDETIIFNSLSREVLSEIVSVMLKDVKQMGKEKKIKITISKDVEDFLVDIGFDDHYGARPLRRAIGKYIEDEIAELYIKGDINEGDKILISMNDREVVIVNDKFN